MAKRRSFSKEKKKELIDKYKPIYLESKRSKIDGVDATEELFIKLSPAEQWDKIKVLSAFKKDNPVEKSPTKSEDKTFTYNTVRAAIRTLVDAVDLLDKERINKMLEDLKAVHNAVDTKEERMKEQELQKLADRKKELEEELKELEDLEKELSK